MYFWKSVGEAGATVAPVRRSTSRRNEVIPSRRSEAPWSSRVPATGRAIDGQDDGDEGERPADECREEADDSGGVAGPQPASGLQHDYRAEADAGEKPRDVQPVAVQEEPSLEWRLPSHSWAADDDPAIPPSGPAGK